jgi:hypothetical protein
MFDGENCVRCRKRFKFEDLRPGPDGFSICEPCEGRIALATDPKRRCPVDGSEMDKRIVGGVALLDKCLSCGGVWFDNDELPIVNHLIKQQAFQKALALAFLV